MDDILLVNGCPHCDLFKYPKKVVTKLYYPARSRISKNTEFIIIDCQHCGKPIVIFRDHVTTISKEQWGHILYRCRNIFGNGIRLKLDRNYVNDHWYAHINNINTTKSQKTKDLRKY